MVPRLLFFPANAGILSHMKTINIDAAVFVQLYGRFLMVKHMSSYLLLLSRGMVASIAFSLILVAIASGNLAKADGPIPSPNNPPPAQPSQNFILKESADRHLSNSFQVHNFVPILPSAYVKAFGLDNHLNYYYFKTPAELNAFLQGTDRLLYDANVSSALIQQRQRALEIAEKILKEFDGAKTNGFFPADSQQMARDLLEYSRNRLLFSVSGKR